MKLLIVCQYFYPEQFRVSDVCFKLASMGHEVTVLTGLPNYPAGNVFEGYQWDTLSKDACGYHSQLGFYTENINGVKVIRCRLYPRKTGKLNLCRNYISYAFQASKTAYTLARSKFLDFDKVLVFQFSPVTMAIPGIILKKALKKPLMIYSFDLWPESIVSVGLPNHGLLYQILLLLSKWIYRKADIIAVSSRSFEKYFKQKLNIHKLIQYLPIYAEDLFHCEQDGMIRELTLDQTGINLVFAGNIGEMQSMDTIIKAADLLKDNDDIHFHIVGDGSALQKSLALAKYLSLTNVTFHGRHPLEAMPRYYSIADAFLVTLKKDPFISYTLPGKIQSYMAAGKPILAAIDGEAYETIQAAGCGLCCPAEDFKGLAGIITEFAKNKSNHRIMGDCAKAYYNANFSEASFFKSLQSLLV